MTPRSSRRRGRPRKGVLRDDEHVLMRRRTSKRTGNSKWSLVWNDEDDLAPYLDASWLLAELSEAVLRAHVEAIREGNLARGGPQKPLDPFGEQGRLARKGDRPDERGVTRTDGRAFPDLLTRGQIKASGGAISRSRKSGTARVGTRAKTEIKPGMGNHTKFLAKDLEQHGVEYLFVDGEIEKLIDAELSSWLDRAFEGPPSEFPEFGSVLGRDA